jgi:hypothetical protein
MSPNLVFLCVFFDIFTKNRVGTDIALKESTRVRSHMTQIQKSIFTINIYEQQDVENAHG